MSSLGDFCREDQEFHAERDDDDDNNENENHHYHHRSLPVITTPADPPIQTFVYQQEGLSKTKIPPCDSRRRSQVTRVVVDPSVQRIENNAFQNCTDLQSMSLSESLEKIGKRAFSGCTKLSQIQWKQGLRMIDSQAFQNCYSLVELNLPEGLVRIADDAFFGCESLRIVRIPKTVEIIGAMAFCGCFALVDVYLQEGLKALGPQAFRSCKNLANICLPNGLKSIRKSTFQWCKSLASIAIPQTVEMIEVDAFRNCAGLVDVSFPKGLRFIGLSAFENCTSLSTLVLPASLEEIGAFAFQNCRNLMGVEVPRGMKARFCDGSFNGCFALITLSIPQKDSPLLNTVLSGCDMLEKVEFDKRLVEERFANLPVHDVCYHSSLATVAELTRALDSYCCSRSSSRIVEDQHLKDAFGLTPFHVVATTLPNERVDILDCLLDRYPAEILTIQDERGMTMMDYLLKQTSHRVVPWMQLVLRKGFMDRI